MHEMSIARAIFRQIQSVEEEHGLAHACGAQVELGPLSGVEPLLLKLACDELIAQQKREPLELEICEVPLVACCEVCQGQFEIQELRFQCPTCAATQLKIIQGDGVFLVHVDLDRKVAAK